MDKGLEHRRRRSKNNGLKSIVFGMERVRRGSAEDPVFAMAEPCAATAKMAPKKIEFA